MSNRFARLLLLLLFYCAAAFSDDPVQWSKEEILHNPTIGNYKGYAEFKMAHYAAARFIWETLAGVGNPEALFNLGILAEDGLGQPKDLQKAEALYIASADAGGFKAQYRLGVLYSTPSALPENLERARHYLGLAAQGGDADAVARLAALGQPGHPLSDFDRAENLASGGQYTQAAALYKTLAQAGNMRARTRLAWLYEAGQGVERNLDEAATLFMDSARQGDAEAQYALAVMYKTGKGQVQDDAASRYWLQRSAAQKYPAAVAALAAQDQPDPVE